MKKRKENALEINSNLSYMRHDPPALVSPVPVPRFDPYMMVLQTPTSHGIDADPPTLNAKANNELDQMEAETFATRTPPAPSAEPPLKRGRPPTSGMKNHPSYAAMVRDFPFHNVPCCRGPPA